MIVKAADRALTDRNTKKKNNSTIPYHHPTNQLREKNIMKITRKITPQMLSNAGNNGNVEIELTPEEIRNASEEYGNESCKQDIKSKLKDIIKNDIGVSNVEFKGDAEKEADACADGSVSNVQRSLDRNDSYWESFWDTIEQELNEYMEANQDENIMVHYETDNSGKLFFISEKDGTKIAEFNSKTETMVIYNAFVFYNLNVRKIIENLIEAY
jgi:hypothetical protein